MGLLDSLSGGGGGGSLDSGFSDYKKYLKEGRNAYTKEIQPIINTGYGAYGEIGNLLGMGDDQAGAMERFYATPGNQYAMDQMTEATQRQFAASGMTNSGNVLTALQDRSRNLADQQFGTYLSQLSSFAQPALTAKQNKADMLFNYNSMLGSAAMAGTQFEQGGGGGFSSGGALGGMLQGMGGMDFGGMFDSIGGMFGGGGGGSGVFQNSDGMFVDLGSGGGDTGGWMSSIGSWFGGLFGG